MDDPRVGRFFAIDPLFRDYPHNSPYAFSENRVIDSKELEGLETATATINARGTFLFVSLAVGATVAVGPNGISLFVTPEGGVGAGASISGGMSYQFYPNVTNTEQIGGWGVNIGGSVAGNGGDVSFSLQQDKTGKVEDVKIGGTIPKIAIPTKMQYGGGAGVEGHLTVGYSFLIGTLTWKDLVGGIEEWAAESGIPVKDLKEALNKAQAFYKKELDKALKTEQKSKPSVHEKKLNDSKDKKEGKDKKVKSGQKNKTSASTSNGKEKNEKRDNKS